MLRQQISDALKSAMKGKDGRSTSTLRLILAALKDRDIADRSKGNTEGINDDGILTLLQSMIKQRRESITMYEKGGRMELAQGEAEEIAVIERFLPTQMSDDEVTAAVTAVIEEVGAESIKEMGKVMGALKQKYSGQMDFSKAGAVVKARLG